VRLREEIGGVQDEITAVRCEEASSLDLHVVDGLLAVA
jgi:hypothetical protein